MTEYTVALRYLVKSPVGDPLAHAEKLRASLGALESRSKSVGSPASSQGGNNVLRQAEREYQQRQRARERARERENAEILRDVAKIEREEARAAAAKERAAVRASQQVERASAREAAARTRAAQQAARAEQRELIAGTRAFLAAEAAKRNAAFRRLQAQQREEERFTRYRIQLMRREQREAERAQRAIAAARARREEERAGNRRSLVSSGFALTGSAIRASGAVVAAGATYAAYEAVNTARYIETARLRLKQQLGSTEAANLEIRDALRIAEKTVFDPDQVIDAIGKLSVNFKDATVRRYILGAVSDFATATGEGNEGLERSIRAISQIAGKGKLQQEELTGQLGELGLSATEVYKQLATLLQVKGKTEQEQRDKVIKLITKGQVDSNTAIQAITNVMRNLRPAGSIAVESEGTLDSAISNLQKGLLTLYATAGIEQWPALVALKGLLKDIAAFFSVDSQSGQAFMAILNEASATTIAPFLEELRGSLSELLTSFQTSPEHLRAFLTGIIEIGKALAVVIKALAITTSNTLELIGTVARWGRSLTGTSEKAGEQSVAGLAAGLKRGQKLVYDAATQTARVVPDATSQALDVHSPSRVMRAIGRNTTQGFALGVRDGYGEVGRSVGGLPVVAAGTARGSIGGGAGSYNVSLSISLPVMSAADPSELAREGGALIGSRIQLELDRYFGRKLAQGVA